MMKTFKTYFFNNFPINHTALLTIVTMLYVILLVLTYLITGGFYLLITFVQFPFPLDFLNVIYK